MLNYIWFALMAIAFVVAIFNGTADAVTKGAIESAKTAVEISIGLVGVMTLWLGIMRVAEASGLVTVLGRLLRPIMRLVFPEVPPDHPANGSIIMSIAANMLGLNNAATPHLPGDLHVSSSDSAGTLLNWSGQYSRGYRVEHTPSLSLPVWQIVGAAPGTPAGVQSLFFDPASSGQPQGFYRLLPSL